MLKLPIDHVEIGTADATCQDFHQHIGWSWYGRIGVDRVDAASTELE
jgi:hypothetical protein